MESRNFHTALIGGFRKKDVVGYLAEEKRLQEAQVEELRRSQAELEQQLDEVRTSDGANRQLSEELQAEVETLRQQLELTRADLDTAREAQHLAESRLTQAEGDRLALEERLAAAQQQNQSLNAENHQLRETVEELLARPDVRKENEALRAQLESQLRQLASRKEESGSADQLWALCGKMERTIRQMEQMLDGPYHMTCYPGEPFAEKAAAPIFEEPEEPSEEPAERPAKARPSVSSLLQRVRGK